MGNQGVLTLRHISPLLFSHWHLTYLPDRLESFPDLFNVKWMKFFQFHLSAFAVLQGKSEKLTIMRFSASRTKQMCCCVSLLGRAVGKWNNVQGRFPRYSVSSDFTKRFHHKLSSGWNTLNGNRQNTLRKYRQTWDSLFSQGHSVIVHRMNKLVTISKHFFLPRQLHLTLAELI